MSKIVILSGGAAHGLVKDLAPAFEAEHSCEITGTFGAVGAMREMLTNGSPADMLILTRAIIDALAEEGRVVAQSVRDVGTVTTAVAVQAGKNPPDVSDAEALKSALLAADEIYFPDPALATAGIHVAAVLRKLGLEEVVRERVRTFPNGATAMRHLSKANSSNPIGITQTTEILAEPGVTLVAPLPQGSELVTTYTAACASTAEQPELAGRFIARLTAEDTGTNRSAAGFE